MQAIPEDAAVDQTVAQDAADTVNTKELLFTRMEDICLLPKGRMAIADHANGTIILDPEGQVFKHLNSEADCLSYSVKYDDEKKRLIVLILDTPGWKVNFYSKKDYTLEKSVALPDDPDIPRMKLRWLCVTPKGEIIVITGHKFILYDEVEDGWALMHEDYRKDSWFSSLTKVPIQGNRFLVCYKGETIQEVRLDEDGGLSVLNKDILPKKTLQELGCYTIDKKGNILVADWETGVIIQLNNAYKIVKSVGNVANLGPYVMVANESQKLFIACKNSMEIRVFNYGATAST